MEVEVEGEDAMEVEAGVGGRSMAPVPYCVKLPLPDNVCILV